MFRARCGLRRVPERQRRALHARVRIWCSACFAEPPVGRTRGSALPPQGPPQRGRWMTSRGAGDVDTTVPAVEGRRALTASRDLDDPRSRSRAARSTEAPPTTSRPIVDDAVEDLRAGDADRRRSAASHRRSPGSPWSVRTPRSKPTPSPRSSRSSRTLPRRGGQRRGDGSARVAARTRRASTRRPRTRRRPSAAQALAWQGILRGESEDFAACGGGMLDEWTASLVAQRLGNAQRADGLKRELRRRGVAAFGLVDQAA